MQQCAIKEFENNQTLFEMLVMEGLSNADISKWRDICEFNLERELAYVVRAFNYREQHAKLMEVEYRKFLFIRVMHLEQKIPMSKEVDAFWHAHVMSTRNYKLFVDEIAGGNFIHHRPTISESENMALMPQYLEGTLVRYA